MLSHYKGGGFRPVPEHQLFADPSREQAAVRIALQRLVTEDPVQK